MSDGIAADVRPLHVLLLEDSRFDAELLRESLLRSYPRASLRVVSDEAAFGEALGEGGWHLILSDYELPGFTGAQALQVARERLPQVPFIFVSGVIGEDNAVEMLKRGATDYVSKSRLSRMPIVVERALREVSERDARSVAEARLREADAMYARVVDALRDYAVLLLDTDGCIQTWNRGARDLFGYEAHEMVGRHVDALTTPEDRASGVVSAELAQARAQGSVSVERWMLRRDGLQMRADCVMNPIYSDAGVHTGYSKIVRDATAQYRNAEALRAAKDQAEQANAAKDRFLAVLSHELRTPLTPIVAATHLLERVATVPQRHAHLLPMIRRNVALEARLIEDLLDLTAISAGKISLHPTTVDMHQVITRVLDMLREQLREASLTVEQTLDAPNALVNADEARMQQVVWNILRNAIKFTPAGGFIRLRTSLEDGRFILRCTDTGIGIEAEAIGRIFVPFEQADDGVSRRYGGLGLGLAIAKGLVAEHKGEITVDSEGRDRGATFTLALQSLDAANERATIPEVQQQLPAEGCRLLLVEDNLDAAATMSELLETYGYRVVHAATCARALEAARAHVFDVVLTDLGLPDGSGIDVGRELSRVLPVVALSGYGASPDLQRTAMAGFAGHLVKPADPDTIHAALQQALAAHAERRGDRQRAA